MFWREQKNGQNFGKKSCWAQFQLWASFDSSSSCCYCYSFSFLQITLWCKIGFGRAGWISPKTLPTCFLYPREYCSYRHKSRLCAHKPAPFMPIRRQDTAVPFYAYQRTEGDAAQFADKHKRGRLGLTQRPLFCLPCRFMPIMVEKI